MHVLARLGALALSTVALAACGSTPSDAGNSASQVSEDSLGNTLSGNLDGEIRHAQLLRTQGDFAGAVHVLSQLMLVAADDPRVVGEYGKTLTQQGRSSEALDFLKRAVVLQPGDWTLYSAMGVAYDQLGDSANARLAYDRALGLKPGEAVVLNNYAMSRMQAGDIPQARRLMAMAVAAGSADPKLKRNLAMLDGLAGQNAQTANQAPVTSSPLEKPAEPARHAPIPLAAAGPYHAPASLQTQATPRTIMMQQVPYDAKAGRVGTKKIAAAKPARKLAAIPKLRKSALPVSPQSAKNKIPELRLANDRP